MIDPRGNLWTRAEEDRLVVLYKRVPTHILARQFGRTEQALRLKYFRLKPQGNVSKREHRNVSRGTLGAVA